MNRPYPDRKVSKTPADAWIFHGQMAKARNSTTNCPRGIVKYFGKRSVESLPKGIMLAAMLVPRMENIQQKAQRKMSVRAPGVQ